MAAPEADPQAPAQQQDTPAPWEGIHFTTAAEVHAVRRAIRQVAPYLDDKSLMAAAGDVLDAREAGRPVRITWDLPPEVKALIERLFNGNGGRAVEPEPGQQQAGHPAAEELAITRLSEIEAQEISWYWPGRFPLRKPSLIAGDPGLGKSMITLDMTARGTRGLPWPDGSGNAPQGSVILLSAEDDAADTIRPRLEAAGADCSKVFIIEAIRRVKGGTRSFCLTEDLALLAAEIERLGDVVLVVVDPISAYLGDVDTHVNAAVRGILAPLADLAGKYGPCVLAVSHLNKSGGGAAVYRVTGSLAFTAAARAVWAVAKDPHSQDGRRLMLPVKCNLAPDQEGLAYRIRPGTVPTVEWGGAVAVDVTEALTVDPTEERNACGEAMAWLQETLKGGQVAATQIRADARANGIAERTLWRAKKKVGAVAEKIGTCWFWKLSSTQGSQGCQPCQAGQGDNLGRHGSLEPVPAPGEGALDL